MSRKHHDLRVWQRSIDLVKEVYRLTSSFPAEERFALNAQMRRAKISAPSNSAEGAARSTVKEYSHFLYMARGSLSELETQLVIARILGYSDEKGEIDTMLEDVFALLSGLIRSKE